MRSWELGRSTLSVPGIMLHVLEGIFQLTYYTAEAGHLAPRRNGGNLLVMELCVSYAGGFSAFPDQRRTDVAESANSQILA